MCTALPSLKRVGLLAIVLPAGAIAVLALWAFLSQSRRQSVCFRTGMIRYSHVRGPFRQERIVHTRLSRVLVEAGLRKPDEHAWVDAHGDGRRSLKGRYTASGYALSVANTVNSPQVASTVRLLIDHTDAITVERWLGRVLHPEWSSMVKGIPQDVDKQAGKNAFVRWLNEKEEEFVEVEKPMAQRGGPLTNRPAERMRPLGKDADPADGTGWVWISIATPDRCHCSRLRLWRCWPLIRSGDSSNDPVLLHLRPQEGFQLDGFGRSVQRR